MYLSTTKYKGSESTSIFGLPELYYTPKTHKALGLILEIKPTMPEMMERYFITDGEHHYGYYTGLKSLNDIHGTTQVPATIEIKSNKVTEKSVYTYGSIKYIIYPASKEITTQNHIYLEVLDDIEEMYNYFEEDIIECIRYVVNKLNLSKQIFQSLFNNYSERTKEVINNVFAQRYNSIPINN